MNNYIYFEAYGNSYEGIIVKSRYTQNNNLYLGVCLINGELYGNITTNTEIKLKEGMALLDTNNSSYIIDALPKEHYEIVGCIPSGYCVYPVVKFNDEFLDSIIEYDEYLSQLEHRKEAH